MGLSYFVSLISIWFSVFVLFIVYCFVDYGILLLLLFDFGVKISGVFIYL